MATELGVHPAVQRANDVLGMAFAVQHQRLPMPTDIADQFSRRGRRSCMESSWRT